MYINNPFGNPDGSRTEIADMMSEFILFDKKNFSSGLTSPDNMKTRVIVGAKGSGKTVYLRRLRANLMTNDSIYATEIEQEVPSTDLIVRFGQFFSEQIVTEKWMYLWKFAILRAVVSNILKNNDWNQDIGETEKKRLLKYTDILFPDYDIPMTIYAEARDILMQYSSRNLFNTYAGKKEWDELETIVGNILKMLPPIYFFIDSIDEEFGHAPMYWLRCQKGLFYRIMRLIRKSIYGNKLHVVICIRDNVMASVCRSEHSTRYINENHVKILNWDYRSIQYFFESKIEGINACFFTNEDCEKTLYNWLGVKTIHNNYRNMDEPIMQYILRHTRLLPRDIVIIGNSLSKIKQMKSNNPNLDVCWTIRKKVAECAKAFGDELLQICANQLNNNEMPKGAAHREFSEVYTSVKEYKESTSQLIKEVLSQLSSDKFSWEHLCSLIDEAKIVLGEDNKMIDILWQNGGLGYIEEGPNGNQEIFFNPDFPEFLLPKKKKTYILRSCLIDAIGISNSLWDTKPVIGGNIE